MEKSQADYENSLVMKFHHDDGTKLSVYSLFDGGAKIGDVVFDISDFKNVKVLNKFQKNLFPTKKL